jgi:uncharacterized OsmC-like protein
MTFNAEQIEVIRHGVHERETRVDRAAMRGLYRIQIDVTGGLAYRAHEASEPHAEMVVGEPPARGGSGTGASPLAHFLTGVGSCLLNQFVRVGLADGLDVQFTSTQVRGEFRRESGGAFERIRCRVLADGALSQPDAERLVERAEALCYVHVTLQRAVEMTTILCVGGTDVVTRVSGPSPAATSHATAAAG